MMLNLEELTTRLSATFNPRQSRVLAETFVETANGLARRSDLSELKEVVTDIGIQVQELVASQKELAASQQRTELQIRELTAAQQELATAQQRTELQIRELTVAQQELTASQQELTASQQELTASQQRTEANLADLTRVVKGFGQELGGMSRSMSYALENEAYRLLPPLLESKYDIILDERLVRTEINGEEINIFARGSRNGEAILIVGESKLQLDERRNSRRALDLLLDQLERKVNAVREVYPDVEIVPLLITHYARPAIRERAQNEGVILIQSFEW